MGKNSQFSAGIQLTLYSNVTGMAGFAVGAPGLALSTPFNQIGSIPTGSFGLVTFTAPANTVLAPETDYWIVASYTGSGSFDFEATSGPNSGNGYIGPLLDFAPNNGTNWFSNTNVDIIGQLNAMSVPEISPASVGLPLTIIVGLFLVLFDRRPGQQTALNSRGNGS